MPITDKKRGHKRKRKRRATLKDPLSTGRKEAARLYPLDYEGPCEWSTTTIASWMGLDQEKPITLIQRGEMAEEIKEISGSKIVIAPCEGLQAARHHGPDKNTLNNEPGNVHRICHSHHNLWHALNDENYNGTVGTD